MKNRIQELHGSLDSIACYSPKRLLDQLIFARDTITVPYTEEFDVRHLWIFVLLITLCACGGEDDSPGQADLGDDSETETDDTESETDADTHPDTDSDSAGDTGIPEDTESESDTPTDSVPSDTPPIIAITWPEPPPSGDFSAGAILIDDRITALCNVTPDPASVVLVDRETVRFLVVAREVEREVAASPTSIDNEYSANLFLGDMPTGPVTIYCRAADLAGQEGEDSVGTYLDLGPQIDVIAPPPSSTHSGEMELFFSLEANPVSDEDPWAEPDISSLSVTLGSVDVRDLVAEDPPGSLTFRGLVSFSDPRFDPAIDGENTLRITVANSRPGATIASEAQVTFTADSQGPQMTLLNPSPGTLLSGIFDLAVDVTDSADVDEYSVVATIAGIWEITLTRYSGQSFSAQFDSRVLPADMVFPNIVIRAQDQLGNQSQLGLIVSLDNQPPLMSLDPPDMREAFYNHTLGRLECSWMFDPLGGYDPLGLDPDYGDAADDGESVAQLVEIRARVEDRGNSASSTSGVLIPMAGVAQGSLQLFILDDEDGALLVDTNGDGFCDDINPLLVPSSVPQGSDEAATINLAGLAPQGWANFLPIPSPGTVAQPEFDTSPGSPEAECQPGTATDTPSPVCSTSPGTRITESASGGMAIFSIPPVNNSQCWGNPIDTVATNMEDGWACLAVRGEDNVGNMGISAPLRLCFDRDGDGAECPPWGTITTTGLPDCTGRYDPDSHTVDASADCVVREADLPAPPSLPRSLLFEDYPDFQLRHLN